MNVDQSLQVVKKLKLTGTPTKVYKNTAFIKDMFNSALEVAKFEGAAIRTVSGIRGQVKKALQKPEGAFRATFEDKVLMSDIVFLRAWTAVEAKKLYNPVTSLLLSHWKGMRSIAEIRRDQNLPVPQKEDSQYHEIERSARRFNPLIIPKSLQESLPFASKPKQHAPKKKLTYTQKRAVVMEKDEKKIYSLMQAINTIRNEKTAKRKAKMKDQRMALLKKKTEESEKKAELKKERAKAHYQKMKRSNEGTGAPPNKKFKKH
jgi:ribosome biogenesis protein BMS1